MNHGDHHYFVLHTDDLPATEAFFRSLLGWEIDQGELTNLAFFGALSDQHDRAIWVHVDDCDAACAKIESLGGKSGEIVDQQSGRNATCVDDQGNTFHVGTLIPEYQDYSHPDRQSTGELSYLTLPVGDTDKGVEFYTQLFGWTFEPAGSTGIQPDYRHCNNGALQFGLTSRGDVSPGLYFQVGDATATAARVVELGGSHGGLVDSDSGLTLTGCTAPGNVRFELWQPSQEFEPR